MFPADHKRAALSRHDKSNLRIMLLAKHACGDGSPDPADGNHAVYHHELKNTLRQAGFNVTPVSRFEDIERAPATDFVIPLLNRAGFEHSEMLAPLLLVRHGIPFLGASPILRGVADDKHLMKRIARAHDVPTADWQVFRRGGGNPGSLDGIGPFPWVVKPNASSASWGISIVDNEPEAMACVQTLWAQGHDVLVERWLPQIDVAVPVIGDAAGAPWPLPPMMYLPEDGRLLRSYEEKRGLRPTEDDPLVPVSDPALVERLTALTEVLVSELWPFDYGRFEFRYDPATGAVSFMEVNLSCNLWSKKTMSRSAGTLGINHTELIEAIVGHSLLRQGLVSSPLEAAA
jgi:D-alanine-D-alanine ligase